VALPFPFRAYEYTVEVWINPYFATHYLYDGVITSLWDTIGIREGNFFVTLNGCIRAEQNYAVQILQAPHKLGMAFTMTLAVSIGGLPPHRAIWYKTVRHTLFHFFAVHLGLTIFADLRFYIPRNQWSYIVGTFSESFVQSVYLNGQLVLQQQRNNPTVYNPANLLYFGRFLGNIMIQLVSQPGPRTGANWRLQTLFRILDLMESWTAYEYGTEHGLLTKYSKIILPPFYIQQVWVKKGGTLGGSVISIHLLA